MYRVDYLVCSEKFALQYAGNVESALVKMAKRAPNVVISLGEKGLIWQRGTEQGHLAAFPIIAIDTTGAGDAFHGAFAAAIAANISWLDTLRYASAAGALCCTKMGARLGIPSKSAHHELLAKYPNGRVDGLSQ
jgi:sulfofructose kinase